MTTEVMNMQHARALVEEALRWLPTGAASDTDALASLPFEPAPGPRSSVLLAEDNADMRDYVVGLLEADYDVTAVTNGRAALDEMQQFRPDLVLSDVMMPVIDGFEMLRAIRADPKLRDLPVILLSARARAEDQIEGLDIGADDYITKPFSARELRARVRANLSLARMRRAATLAMVESEEKLQRLNEQLEVRVRTEVLAREVAQARLARDEKMTALGQLAAGMAHDFNNILQVVGGCAILIGQKSEDSAAVRRLVGMVEAAAGRGTSISRRLLFFARRDELRAEAIDVPSLFEGMREGLAQRLSTNVILHANMTQDLPNLMADRSQLETALMNLATNAADAMPQGGTLTFAASSQVITDRESPCGLSPGVYLLLSATDTGSGMDSATLARVTEPFFTTKPVGKGTGLGLALASSFAEQSGGALTIVSAPGQGTTVTIQLPSTSIPAARSPTPLDRTEAAPGLPKPRILLVDDEGLVRGVIAEVLVNDGYDVIQAEDAATALAMMKAGEKIDLLLSDLSMPGLDGISLIRAAQNDRPNLPAVLLTGYAGDAALLALGEGSFSLLRKPVNVAQLGAHLASVLEANVIPEPRRAPVHRGSMMATGGAGTLVLDRSQHPAGCVPPRRA